MLRRALLASCLVVLSACRATGGAAVKAEEIPEGSGALPAIPATPGVTPPTFAPGPKLCAGVRGNGELVMAHFAALARIVEHYGLIDAMMGGSSGSISTFFYESIYANPLVHACNGAACAPEESAARAALMLKSIQGYVSVLASTDEAVAFMQIEPVLAKLKSAGLTSTVVNNFSSGRKALTELLTSKDLRDIVSKEALTTLATSGHPIFHSKDLGNALLRFGSWKAEEPSIFVRPGFFDFKALGRKLGRLANFYAGYGPYDKDGVEGWLDQCATPGRGKDWSELKALAAGGSTCGDRFLALAGAYRKKLIPVEATTPSRIDDPIGKYMPALAVDAVLEGEEAMKIFTGAQKQYMGAKPIEFKMNFDLVKIGYWGRDEDLARIGRNERGFDDLKTKKFLPLGQKTWAEVIGYSPAEPGLNRMQVMSPTRVSAGGWPDLHPMLALRNLGCENIVYVTRRGDESAFIQGMTKLLGMTDEQHKAYFDLDAPLDQPPSAIRRSLQEADAVWCTNWNAFGAKQVGELSDHSYNAPLGATSDFFRKGANPYPNAADKANFRECSPDAPAGAL